MLIKVIINKIIFLGMFLLMVACTNNKPNCLDNKRSQSFNNTYLLTKDSHPELVDIRKLSLISDVLPKYEPKSRYGNPPKYKVFNKTYKVLNSSVGYKESGYASWYGTKFHGFRTSSGDIYDMYSMTAAHKTLPLPTYAKITNLSNNRSVIVKINDRGPFHDDRVIDLSYAAAYKLGILDKGTAKVEVVAIDTTTNCIKKDFDYNTNTNTVLESSKGRVVHSVKVMQLGAFTVEKNAEMLVDKIKKSLQSFNQSQEYKDLYEVNIIKDHLQNENKKNILYKVMLCSKQDNIDMKKIKQILAKIPIEGAFIK